MKSLASSAAVSLNTRLPARGATVIALAAAIALAACADMSERQKGTAGGAAIGAVGGAILSKATGGKAGTGAVVGGAVGAVAGNLWSKRMEDKRKAMEAATQGTGIDVVRTTDNQLKVNIPADFSFDVGRSAVKPVMVPVLDKLAQGLDATVQVQVIGHTDSSGSDAVNNPLSLDRAEAVRDYLSRHGVPAARIQVEGRGEREPVADNATPDGRAQNRRVEIFLREPQPS
ncbi:OmpA/MotB domain protein [Leptothrix cholodnii SP-6]|uniref:OmpA/MotB domain protein n=1 Tax=Leptothrix cholodnii (strain ATCC 51168 / LMG 8142 / SP-6) TaxID=395495 RepID=B1XYJ3_LEPCP|nr:OmpA family protein [Leptothrix cholodnii]ACB36429.1 OmpA/MotB domain protein [Leptothrix cholodnii SP-6]